MASQGVVGTRQQRADLNEQIPASEFRKFMQEMQEFKKEANKKSDILIHAGNDRDGQIKRIVEDMGKLRKDIEDYEEVGMQFLVLDGAIVRRHETGKLEKKLTVCFCCYRADDTVLLQEMRKPVDLPVYCGQCGNEIKKMDISTSYDR